MASRAAAAADKWRVLRHGDENTEKRGESGVKPEDVRGLYICFQRCSPVIGERIAVCRSKHVQRVADRAQCIGQTRQGGNDVVY